MQGIKKIRDIQAAKLGQNTFDRFRPGKAKEITVIK